MYSFSQNDIVENMRYIYILVEYLPLSESLFVISAM